MKLKVKPEGRKGIYIPEKEDLKEFIKSRKFKTIHNFIPSPGMYIGADHSVARVLKDIDRAERVGVLTEESGSDNMGHALSLILPLPDELGGGERLGIYNIGKITEDDLEIVN